MSALTISRHSAGRVNKKVAVRQAMSAAIEDHILENAESARKDAVWKAAQAQASAQSSYAIFDELFPDMTYAEVEWDSAQEQMEAQVTAEVAAATASEIAEYETPEEASGVLFHFKKTARTRVQNKKKNGLIAAVVIIPKEINGQRTRQRVHDILNVEAVCQGRTNIIAGRVKNRSSGATIIRLSAHLQECGLADLVKAGAIIRSGTASRLGIAR